VFGVIGRARGSEPGPATSATPPAVLRNLQTLSFGATGSLLHQFARYLCVGGLAFVVDFASLYLLTEFAGLHYLISAAMAFLFGLITNYFLSRVWVFDRRTMGNAAIEFAVFAAIGVVGLGLNEFIIWSIKEKIHLHYMAAKTVSAGVVLVWNFGARKVMLFR
jgi:putative flippase GtrA